MSEFALRFEGVVKDFGEGANLQQVVRHVNFSVRDGEFFAILGPSGCGKTTLLRMISGLEKPTRGKVYIGDKVVNDVHPHKRNVHMVFQKYALFPHLDVFDNVAFGLRMKRLDEKEIRARVDRMLSMVKLSSHAHRPIQKLSGGEQQRVALVRALVNEPKILLLDEPLGALDQKLREEMQQELTTIQKNLKTTFVFVTHDQNEALTLADRIAIMNKGQIEQIGTPNEVYESPQSAFVARFVGTGNYFDGHFDESFENTVLRVKTHHGDLLFVKPPEASTQQAPFTSGQRCKVLVRPEKIRIRSTGPDKNQMGQNGPLNVLRGTLTERVYFGATTQIKLQISDSQPPLIALVANQSAQKMPSLKLGDKYYAVWDATDSICIQESSPQ